MGMRKYNFELLKIFLKKITGLCRISRYFLAHLTYIQNNIRVGKYPQQFKRQKTMPGFVHIIESPSDEDLLDGRTEGKVISEALKLASIPHTYNLATTQTTFNGAIYDRLAQAWHHFSQPPVLHLSMHGNNEGVQLTDSSFLQWDTLRNILSPLNNIMNGGLLICMSSCFGAAGCRMAMHLGNDHLFWALVGNSGSVAWNDAAVAYVSFYHLFFKGISIFDCVEAMKRASYDHNFNVFSGRNIRNNWISFMAQQNIQPPTPEGLMANLSSMTSQQGS